MNTKIPALSLKQPWAWAVLYAGKTTENRTWATHYRGRIRIHASQTWDEQGLYWLIAHGFGPPSEGSLRKQGQMGVYLGEVTITHCRAIDPFYRETHQPWAFGPVCWELLNPMPYPEPIPGRGYPGLYFPERFTQRDHS